MSRFSILIFCIITLSELLGQHPVMNFRTLSKKDGLNNNIVTRVIQDSEGYMWIGSHAGIFRYDSKNFIPYYYRPGRKSIQGSMVSDIYEDTERHKIIVSTQDGGIDNIDLLTDEISSYTFPALNNKFRSLQLFPLNQDTLLIPCNEGIGLLDLGRDTIELLNNEDAMEIRRASPNSNKVYILGKSEIFELDNKSLELKSVKKLKFRPQTLMPISDSKFLIGTWGNGVYVYDRSVDSFNHSYTEHNINRIERDKDGLIWVASYTGGLGLFDPIKDELVFMKKGDERFSQINSNSVGSVSDAGDLLWIGTSSIAHSFSDALNIYDPAISDFKFVELHNQFKNKEYFFPTNFLFNEGLVYMPRWLDFGIDIYDQNNNFVKNIAGDISFANATVDSSGMVWSHTFRNLYRIDPNADVRIEIKSVADIIKERNGILTELIDIGGNQLLVASNKGLFLLDMQSLEIEEIELKRSEKKAVKITACTVHKKDLWVATELGLVHVDLNDYVTSWKIDASQDSLFHEISAIEIDESGDIWMMNHLKGLLKYERTSGIRSNFSVLDGFADNRMYFGCMDKNQDLWMIQQNGLSRFNTKTHQITNYNLSEGLAKARIDLNISTAPNGDIYMTGFNGFYRFNPDSLYKLPTVEVHLNSLRVNEDVLNLDTLINYLETITLDHKENNITFDLAILDYHRPGHVILKWKLEGLNEDWLQTDDQRRSISYYGLKPGKYTFQIQTINGVGVSSDIKKFGIIIRPPYWKTWWFIAMLFLVLCLILYQLYKWRTDSIRSKSNMEKRMSELELTALRSQMNPHFIFNTLNSIKAFILKSEPRKAANYLATFAHLIRQTLQQSSENQITLEEELQTLLLYIELEKMRFKEGFEFFCTISSDVDTSKVMVPPLILQPFVENAIWHGLLHAEGDRELTLKINRNEGIEILIEDNGIGRERARQLKSKSATKYKSLGMGITNDRILISNRMNNSGIKLNVIDLKDELGKATGTLVKFHISNISS